MGRITLDKVRKAFGDVEVIPPLDLTIEDGEFVVFVGPSGCGKSTLIRLILGLLKPDAGQITVAGFDLATALPAARKLCGLAPQDPGFFPLLTVAENLRTFGAAAGLRGRALNQAVDSAVASTELGEHANKRADQLSGGMRQRLNVSLALLGHPPVLLLDEPTAGVDAESRKLIIDVLRGENARGATIIYTSHYLTEVEQLCDRVALIDHGKLRFEGKLRDALHHAARLLVVQLTDEPGTTIRERWQSRWPDAVIGPQSLQLETASALSVLATLERDGVTVRSIEYGTSSLEAAYFHMRSTAASADQA
mgnify:CR=1 FL=1